MKRPNPTPSAARVRAELAFQAPTGRRTTQDSKKSTARRQPDSPAANPKTRAHDKRASNP